MRFKLEICFVFCFYFSSFGCDFDTNANVSMLDFYRGDDTILDTVVFLSDRADFDLLASGNQSNSSLQLPEVKFLIDNIRSSDPVLYFINSNKFKYHWKFYNSVLGWNLSLLDFNTRTYTDFNRRMIAGSIVAHDNYEEGIYTIEFWPSDPVHFKDVKIVFDLLTEVMDFAAGSFVYHAAGETQVRILAEELELYQQNRISVINTSQLYNGLSYAAMNTGESYGILRDGNSNRTFSSADIVVFQSIPNDIGHVAGIITTVPQTPLSHINLKAIQNGIPNVYVSDFLESEQYQSLLDRPVRLTALADQYIMEEVSFSEAQLWIESIRPDTVTVLVSELQERRIQHFSNIRLIDLNSYGAKSANLGELTWCVQSSILPDGYAVPFYYYNKFMEYNDFYNRIDSVISSIEFNSSSQAREDILQKIRREIIESPVPQWIVDSLSVMVTQFEPGVSLRCRSSTNNEDLPGFNGAGLYNSFTHHENEGHISETVKQVWAGMWTYRAFEEREFHRIDHFSASMGVAVHPSYKDELANGVAVTNNVLNPFIPGYYINVQPGDHMVTNPQSNSLPEIFIVTEQNITGESLREIQYLAYSNRISSNRRVLSDDQIQQIIDILENIHNHYRILNEIDIDDLDFAMEIEFKISRDGSIVVKQARPWVHRT